MEPKYLNDNDPWMLGEDIPDIDPFFSQIWLSCFANEFAQPSGRAYKKILTLFQGYHLWFHFGEKDSFAVGKSLVDKFLAEPGFIVTVNQNIIKEADKLRAFALIVPEQEIEKLSNRQLADFFKKHDAVHTEYYTWCWIPVAADMFHNNFTDALKHHLQQSGAKDEQVNEQFALLTQPTKKSFIQTEQEEFLEIAAAVQKDASQEKLLKDLFKTFEEQDAAPYGLATHTAEYESLLGKRMDSIKSRIKPAIMEMLQKHYLTYFYVKHLWIGKEGVSSFDYYLKELVKFIGRGGNAEKVLKEKREEQKATATRRAELMKRLSIKGGWITLFDGFGDFMVTKIYRRYAQIYALYRMQPLLEEIAQRLGITKMDARFMLTSEIEDALLHDKLDKEGLKERTRFSVFYAEKGLEKFFIGAEAKKLAALMKPKEIGDVKEFKGQTGCIGKAAGMVKVVIRPVDMAKMNEGDILVSIATDPDIVPAMKKAAAFVTEQGGVTSHAAIVAREMNKPCVIGTKIATRVLKDGDYVEVDATNGVVKKLTKEEYDALKNG